jgi:DNA-binding transcriptional LysR family regulator
MADQVTWDLWRSFLAVARQGSLSGAARVLGATQPTLGRHVEALESGLGIALFTRSQGGLSPTPAALALLAQAEAMEAAAASLRRSADGARSEAGGTVRITASEIMGAEVLPDILAGLQEAHPALVVELVLSNRTDDLLRRDADIAVRMVRPVQEALIAQRLGHVDLGLYAHERYLARHGAPSALADLPRFHVIGFDRNDHSARALAKGVIELDRELFSLRSDSDLAQLAALRAGLGIGACQARIAARNPQLRPVLAGALAFKLDVWLCMHEDQRASRPVRLAYEALADGLRRWIAG